MRRFRVILTAALCGTSVPALAQQADPPVADVPTPAPPIGIVTADSSAAAEQPVAGDALTDDEVMDGEDAAEIVVTGSRPRGTVDTDIPAEVSLNPREIRALGASNVSELLDALAPQTASARGRGGGRPVVLVNGRRISSFSEVRDLPPEAIERVDIFPEEVALQYGYRADQRVVNLVLRNNFNAVTAEVEGGMSGVGGRGTSEIDVNYLTIAGPTRTSFDIEYQNQSALLESQRDIIQATPSLPGALDAGDFRTLLPESDNFSFAAQHSRQLGTVGATVDGRYVITQTRSLLGLPTNDLNAVTPLNRASDTFNGHLGLALNGDISRWRWNFTANFDRIETDTETERLAGSPADVAEQVNQSLTAGLVVNGVPLEGWAGPLRTSFSLNTELRSLDSQSTRSGVFRETSLSRQRFEGQANFDLPITSTESGVLDAIGDLSANLNVNVESFSDFGVLTTLGYGLNWRPTDWLSFIASATHEEGAPSITQLGDPVIATPNVRVFDFVRGETVDITRIDGGNPALLADSRSVLNFGVNLRPMDGLSIRANYTENKITNPIAGFPAATAEIEAAFPGRFVRDADGRLLSIDATPINFAESERREFRWGFDFSAPFGAQRQGGRGGMFGGPGGPGGGPGGPGGRRGQNAPTPMPPAQTEGGQPAAGETPPAQGQQAERPRRRQGGPGFGGGGRRGGGGGGFGGGGFGGGGGGGRMQFSLSHTWRLEDRVLIREGGPELDFLNGSAAGSGGGTEQHQIEARAGLFRDGFGARAEIDWQSGTTVRGVNGTDLDFSPRMNVNLRLFANLGQQRDLVRAVPFFRGTRLSLNIDNLFDQRVEVRDATGNTPINYQPFLLDPVGRSFTISLRKLFF